jgi:basic membrane protein A
MGESESGESDTIKAAFVYDGRVGDKGWSYVQDQARQRLEEKDWIETEFTQEVSASEGEKVIGDFARQDYDMIFTTSVTFQDVTLNVAEQFPDQKFANANGFNMAENMSRYTYRYYEGRFLTGMAAGLMDDVELLGYISPFSIPLVLRDINSFVLGARHVDDSMEMARVPVLSKFYDPQGAKNAVTTLAGRGVNAIGSYMDSTAFIQPCKEREIYASGFASNLMAETAGEWNITVPIIYWDSFYTSELDKIRKGEWESREYWGGLDEGMIRMSEFGPRVPDDVQSQVNEAKEQIKNGELDPWAGSKFEDWGREPGEKLETDMNSYVEGVRGEVSE